MELKVNDSEWNSLSAGEREKVQSIVAGFFKGARIVPDAATAKSAVDIQSRWGGNPICKAACTAAEAGAVAACAALENPIAIAACIAVAHVGGEECRKHC